MFKRVDDLSGGERVRLALCKILKRRPNVLILDEPTNHMDIVGKETLEDMLCAYEGTLIIVSHDRYLINKVADRLLVFGGEEAHFYNCRYEELEERNSDYRGSVSDGDSPFVSGLTQRDCPRLTHFEVKIKKDCRLRGSLRSYIQPQYFFTELTAFFSTRTFPCSLR